MASPPWHYVLEFIITGDAAVGNRPSRCLLAYDVTSRRSFDSVRPWLADVRAHADAHVSCILVGNKVDLVGRG
ncbi:hypothetical protein B0H14DRAFT_3522193 [Mycena olivaceomarginata]|nr:hypothetical protein B0H14DRAFT_3522193 [Mycena olivaceomarginata]